MRAAVSTRYGPPEVVRIREVPTPAVGDRDLLVRVHTATVNRTDCGFRAGTPFVVRAFSGLMRPKATILGGEFAGEVDSVGTGVTAFAPGDRVFGYRESFGAHAGFLAIAEDAAVAPIPDGLTFEQVAASTEGSHYALSLMRGARIREGQRVLVNGATGAIGSAAVQLLRYLGARVTAVCDAENVELVTGLGADRVIDRSTEDFTQDADTYDVVFDAVGKSSFGRCERLLSPKGIYLSTDFGPPPTNPVLAVFTPWLGGRKVVFPIPPRHDQRELRWLAGLLAAGSFRPVVDRRYPLGRIVDAYRFVETGRKIGNVLIDVAEPVA